MACKFNNLGKKSFENALITGGYLTNMRWIFKKKKMLLL